MILVAVRDLLFGSKIGAAARRLGIELAWAPRDRPLSAVVRDGGPTLVLADLGEAGMMDELRATLGRAPGLQVIGFAGHLRVDLIDEARAMGVQVFTRGQLAACVDDVLLRAAS